VTSPAIKRRGKGKVMDKWVIAENEENFQERKRINLSKTKNLNITIQEGQYGTGVSLKSVHLMERSKRVILETYSIWDDGTGRCRGTSYLIAGEYTIAKLAKATGNPDLIALVPELEDK
jgi:hypothetical protein